MLLRFCSGRKILPLSSLYKRFDTRYLSLNACVRACIATSDKSISKSRIAPTADMTARIAFIGIGQMGQVGDRSLYHSYIHV